MKSTSKILADAINLRYKSWIRHFNQIKKGNEEEMIHQLRVDTKKLRALLFLTEIILGDNFQRKSYLDKIENLFKKAGRIRNIHICIIKLNKFDKKKRLQDFRKYLKKHETERQKELTLVIKEFNIQEIQTQRKSLFLAISKLRNLKIEKKSLSFIQSHFDAIKSLMQLLPDIQTTHQIRIHIKAALPILQILHDEFNMKRSKAYINKLGKLEKKIGEWHDMEVLLQKMYKHIKLNKTVSTKFLKTKKRIEKMSKIYLNQIKDDVLKNKKLWKIK